VLEVGGYIAIALIVVEVVLIFSLMRGKTTKGVFAIVSPVIVFAVAFFWMGDRVTEMTIRGVGTIKTAVNIANQYVEDIRKIKVDLEQQQQKIIAQITRLDKLTSEEEVLKREVGLRHIDGPSFLKILDGDPKGEFEIVYGAEDLNSINLAYDLRSLLEVAGWKFINITAVPLQNLLDLKNAMVFPKNIKIEVHSIIGPDEPNLSLLSKPRTLYSVLSGAIMTGLGGVQTLQGGTDPSLPDNRVRITVFPR
jgi:hypothetical protein